MTSLRGILWLALTSAAALSCGPADGAPTDTIAINDNRTPAGRLRSGVLAVNLEAREGTWHPDGADGPGLTVQAFSEAGRALQNPGPMIRVRSGTTIRVTVRSALRDSVLVVYGLHTRPGSVNDTIHVQPGATRAWSFEAGTPGTYFYWATSTGRAVADRNGADSQLHGAFIVDPATGPIAGDRVFVLGSWTGPRDTTLGYNPDLRVINGLSYPHTEALSFDAGDTVLWRWVNPTDSPHPMHLHGFYFDVLTRGSWAADTVFAVADRPRVVTEMPMPGGTFVMRWIAQEPGNWLMHCHVAYHTSLYLAPKVVPDPADPIVVRHEHGMRGMVIPLHVRAGSNPARRAETVAGARTIRLVVQAAPKRFQNQLDEMAFVRQGDAVPPAPDSVPVPSSLLVLRRNEPVRVTIVNRTRAQTGVHWHGIEVPSYSDGVPGFSGEGTRFAPVIAPGDSFTAAFTPTRSGTFMYHAHSNETFQVNLGLYGALLVVDAEQYRPERERLIVLGAKGPAGSRGVRINGRLVPDTMQLTVGTTYRLRIIHIIPDWTARIALLRVDSVLSWKALAKDGAELAPHLQTIRPATLIAGPGETMDYEFTPQAHGMLRLDVAQRSGVWKNSLHIHVR